MLERPAIPAFRIALPSDCHRLENREPIAAGMSAKIAREYQGRLLGSGWSLLAMLVRICALLLLLPAEGAYTHAEGLDPGSGQCQR